MRLPDKRKREDGVAVPDILEGPDVASSKPPAQVEAEVEPLPECRMRIFHINDV